MFIVDEITDQLLVRDASGSDVDIRIPMNAGIAGAVYCKGEIVNIPDAYKDERFNKDTDAKTGYKTTSLLCSPVYDSHGNTIAVLEAINKKNKSGDGFVPFTKEDEVLIDYMAGQVSRGGETTWYCTDMGRGNLNCLWCQLGLYYMF